MFLKKIVLQKDQPSGTDVLWIRPVGNYHVAKVFNHGKWNNITYVTETEEKALLDKEDSVPKDTEDIAEGSKIEEVD